MYPSNIDTKSSVRDCYYLSPQLALWAASWEPMTRSCPSILLLAERVTSEIGENDEDSPKGTPHLMGKIKWANKGDWESQTSGESDKTDSVMLAGKFQEGEKNINSRRKGNSNVSTYVKDKKANKALIHCMLSPWSGILFPPSPLSSPFLFFLYLLFHLLLNFLCVNSFIWIFCAQIFNVLDIWVIPSW